MVYIIDTRKKQTTQNKEENKKMKRFIIDYTRPDGSEDFLVVEAMDRYHARQVFKNSGTDDRFGEYYSTFTITDITEWKRR